MNFLTFQDTIEHLIDYLGGGNSETVVRDCKRAAIEAARTVPNAHNWSYLHTHGRVNTNAPFSAGTIQFQLSSGTYPRQVTLSGSTWPSWVAAGTYLRVGAVNYKVASKVSATVLTLDPSLSPTTDLAAGTAFTLYQDSILLPEDYVSQDQALYENNFGGMTFVHPREWLFTVRYVVAFGTPSMYTVSGDSLYPGRLMLRLAPFPYESRSIDFDYKRRPRPLSLAQQSTGTVAVTSGSATVTGTGPAFTPSMVGSVFRFSSNTTPPTGWVGKTPPVFESVISSYVSATQVAMASPSPANYSGVAFTVSDPVDIEPGTMTNLYLRCCEMHISMSRTLKDKPSAKLQYQDELFRAKCADSRSYAGRAEGGSGRYRQRLRDMPFGPDVSQ